MDSLNQVETEGSSMLKVCNKTTLAILECAKNTVWCIRYKKEPHHRCAPNVLLRKKYLNMFCSVVQDLREKEKNEWHHRQWLDTGERSKNDAQETKKMENSEFETTSETILIIMGRLKCNGTYTKCYMSWNVQQPNKIRKTTRRPYGILQSRTGADGTGRKYIELISYLSKWNVVIHDSIKERQFGPISKRLSFMSPHNLGRLFDGTQPKRLPTNDDDPKKKKNS